MVTDWVDASSRSLMVCQQRRDELGRTWAADAVQFNNEEQHKDSSNTGNGAPMMLNHDL